MSAAAQRTRPLPFDPATEDLEFLAGDKVVRQKNEADPLGTGVIGRSSTVQLDRAALGHPLIRYESSDGAVVLTADVYVLDDGSAADLPIGASLPLEVVILCPRCYRRGFEHQLSIKSTRKKLAWTPGPPEIDLESGTAIARGTLSIEKFGCTWEKDPSRPVTGHTDNLCRWRVVVDNNIARDA